MKKMEYSIHCKDVFRLLACLGLIIAGLGFFSCAASPDSETTPIFRRAAPAAPVTPQVRENKLGSLKIYYVDAVTMALQEAEVQLFTYPDEELAGFEIPFDSSNTYKQLWDEEGLEELTDAVSRFGVAERSSSFGTADARSFTTYGTVDGSLEWSSQSFSSLSAEVRIDLGHIVKDGKTYFLITQRDTQIGEDSGRRTSRITFCITMDQIRKMAGLLGIRLYEKPLLVFLGDGITAGTNATIPGENDPASAYPAVLQDMVTLNILNSGIEWNQVSDALERVEDVLKYDPDIVVINIGFSDFISQVDPSSTARDLQAIVDALRGGDRKLYLTRFYDEFILRNFMDDWEMTDREQINLINVYDAMFRNISRANNIDLISGIWDGLQYEDTISDDYIHPTKEGHKIMAGNFYNALKPYLAERKYLKE